MTPAIVFSIANMLVLPQWALLIFLPKWKGTQWLIKNPVIPAALAIIYLIYVASIFGVEGGGFGSLEEVKVLFGVDEAVLAGWVHYLAFDLLIGSWIVKDSQAKSVNHFTTIPCLFLTFMAGPVGWGLYMILRKFLKK